MGYSGDLKGSIEYDYKSQPNSTDVLLGSGVVYQGVSDIHPSPDVMVSCYSDTDGVLFFEFANENGTFRDFPVNGFQVTAGIHEFHTAVKGPRSFRVRFENSLSAQTEFELVTYFGVFRHGNAPLNQSISSDSDAQTVKAVLAAEKLDGLMQPTDTYNNIHHTLRGGLDVAVPWKEVFRYAVPPDTTLVSGALPIIDAILNIESNVIDTGWVPVKEFGAGNFLNIKSNVELTVFLANASDELGSNAFGLTQPNFTTTPGFPNVIAAAYPDDFFRMIIINASGSVATELTARAMGCYVPPASIIQTLVAPVNDFYYAAITQSVTKGRKPDGSYVNSPADGLAFEDNTLLGVGSSSQSPWIVSEGWNSIQISVSSDQISADLGLVVEFTDDASAVTPTVVYSKEYSFTEEDIERGFLEVTAPPKLNGFRVTYTNGPIALGLFYISVFLKTNSSNNNYNNSGALISTDFNKEVDLGNVVNWRSIRANGRNPQIDTGQSEDIWAGGGTYTGQPIGATPQQVVVVSSSALDTLAGTGARTIKIKGLKTVTSTKVEEEIINLTGLASAVSVNNWYRVWEAEIVTAGSTRSNQGTITVRSILDADVFILMPIGLNKSQVAAFTVPFQNECTIESSSYFSITRSTGAAGSAFATFRCRKIGEVYQGVAYELQTGKQSKIVQDPLPSLTDVKGRIESVSDNNTIAEMHLRTTVELK